MRWPSGENCRNVFPGGCATRGATGGLSGIVVSVQHLVVGSTDKCFYLKVINYFDFQLCGTRQNAPQRVDDVCQVSRVKCFHYNVKEAYCD